MLETLQEGMAEYYSVELADKAERQRLIDSFVNAIYLYEDKIVLVFNFKDGTKTVTLSDIEGSDLSCNTEPTAKKHCPWGSAFLLLVRGNRT